MAEEKVKIGNNNIPPDFFTFSDNSTENKMLKYILFLDKQEFTREYIYKNLPNINLILNINLVLVVIYHIMTNYL